MQLDARDDERPPTTQLILSVPVGLWLFSLGADVMYRTGRGPAYWDHVAFFTMFAGLVVALMTVVPGFIDELAGTVARRAPSGRLWLNLAVVALYVVDLCLRACAPSAMLPVSMSVVGMMLLAASGWLGGEPVHARDLGTARLCLRAVRVETRRAPRSA